jgi:membrane-bound lytic murein transglycosylase B
MPVALSRRRRAPGLSLWLWSLFFVALVWSPPPAFGDWSPLILRLSADGFDEEEVRALFARPEVKFEPVVMCTKIEELLGKQGGKPLGVPKWKTKSVHKAFLKKSSISRARSYMRENSEILQEVRTIFCVPEEIIVSILLVETGLGNHVGGKHAFNRLASMALCCDLEVIRPYLGRKINQQNEERARAICLRKGDWAYEEMKALLTYAERSGLDPLSIPGSLYGAFGICQFMPSNALWFGIDADQDGRVDLFSKRDAMHSMANYLRGHGWQCSMDKWGKRRAIFEYNHSPVYANTVLAVADRLGPEKRSKKLYASGKPEREKRGKKRRV